MFLFRNGERWNGLVVGLLIAVAVMGCLNSVLQLSQYGLEFEQSFASGEQAMIAVWLILLVLWVLVLGLAAGVCAGRWLYGTGVEPGSMTSSD